MEICFIWTAGVPQVPHSTAASVHVPNYYRVLMCSVFQLDPHLIRSRSLCSPTVADGRSHRRVPSCPLHGALHGLHAHRAETGPRYTVQIYRISGSRDKRRLLYETVHGDTNGNMTSREESVSIFDVNTPVTNLFTMTSHVPGHITGDVNVTDDSGGDVFCSTSLYCFFDLDTELDYH